MKRARVMTRWMELATSVACDKEGDGVGCKSDGNEGDGRATPTRAMATAMATTKATAWVMVMVTRLSGDKKGTGKGGKGNGGDNEGGTQATERARAVRQWRR